MADVTKLASRRKGFGAPPSLDEASNNLTAPETAPATPAAAAPPVPAATPVAEPRSPDPAAALPEAPSRPPPAPLAARQAERPLQITPTPPTAPRIDGRSLRRTNRTLTFATRVTPEFDERVRAIAQREGIMLVEVLERALDALDGQAAEG